MPVDAGLTGLVLIKPVGVPVTLGADTGLALGIPDRMFEVCWLVSAAAARLFAACASSADT